MDMYCHNAYNYNQLDNLIPDAYPVDPKELGLGGMAGGDLELELVNDWDSTDCGIKFLFLTSHGFSGADIIKYDAWERSNYMDSGPLLLRVHSFSSVIFTCERRWLPMWVLPFGR